MKWEKGDSRIHRERHLEKTGGPFRYEFEMKYGIHSVPVHATATSRYRERRSQQSDFPAMTDEMPSDRPLALTYRCVEYELFGVGFLSICLYIFVAGRVLAPGSYLCRERVLPTIPHCSTSMSDVHKTQQARACKTGVTCRFGSSSHKQGPYPLWIWPLCR
jgi:hypothetical protein